VNPDKEASVPAAAIDRGMCFELRIQHVDQIPSEFPEPDFYVSAEAARAAIR